MTSFQGNSPVSNNLYGVANGTSSNVGFITVFMTRDPNDNDYNYLVKQRWVNTSNSTEWILTSFTNISGTTTANWIRSGVGNAVIDFGLPNPTSPITPDSNGLVNFTSTGGTITISGSAGGTGAQNINFDITTPTLLPWTPTLYGSSTAGTTTYSTGGQVGSYRVFGGMVFAQFFVIGTTSGGVGNVTIGGLPIPSGSSNNCYGSCIDTSFVWPASTTSICLSLGGGTAMTIAASGSGAAFGFVPISNVVFNVQGSIFYPI
jgi:hypothetical protein